MNDGNKPGSGLFPVRMSEVSRGRALGVLASCVVHAGVVLGMPRGQASERSAVQPLWLELQLASTQPEHEPPAAPPSSAHEQVQYPARPSRSVLPRPTRVTAAPAVLAPTADPVPAQGVPSEPHAASIDLSPLAAARTLDSTSIAVRDAGMSRGPLSHSDEADALARQAPGLRMSRGRSAEGVVVDLVEDTLYDVLRPWKLLRRTLSHGSAYRYTGGGFDAEILADGQVRFHDKDGPQGTMRSTLTQQSGPGSLLPPGVTFELSSGDTRALWQRLRGKDPHAAERRLFLERTRALREHLAGRAKEPDTPAVP